MEIFNEKLSKITNDVDDEVLDWQHLPLDCSSIR
jgi:hypothetical protein